MLDADGKKEQDRRNKERARLELAQRIRSAIELSKLEQKEIAEIFDVSVQAVSGWVRTGKIDKSKIPELARVTHVRLNWLLAGEGEPRNHVIATYTIEEKPKISDQAQQSLAYLQSLAQTGLLADSDFEFIESMVRKFVNGRRRANEK